jgi:hypothetical protein
MNIIFIKSTGRNLTSLSRQHKKERRKHDNQPGNVRSRYVLLVQKILIKRHLMPERQEIRILLIGFKPN